MKIKTVKELEKILINEYNAVVSSVDEINTYEHYSLVGDTEHDYSILHKVYKIKYPNHPSNPYDVIFILIFSKKGEIYDSMTIGIGPEKLQEIWSNVEWESE